MTKYAYQVTPQSGLAGFQVVYCEEEISVCVTVTLTSLDMREQPPEEEAKGLNSSSCGFSLQFSSLLSGFEFIIIIIILYTGTSSLSI